MIKYIGLFLLVLSLNALAGAVNLETQQILDEPEINVVGDEVDIRINFSTPITYLRHFPEAPNNIVRVTLDIPDPCLAEQLRVQESKNSPQSNLITPFVITFPEVVTSSNRGTALCRTTNNRVDTNKTLLIRFNTTNTYKIRLGDDNHSIIVRVPLIGEPIATFIQPQKLTVPIPPEGASAKELMSSGKSAMKAGEYESAVQIFNRLLNLPPNEYSMEAQELVGNARENNGDFAKAKLEYELYLKLYPKTEGALRVNLHLAAIKEGKAKVAENKVSTKKTINQINQTSMFGSLSQYYYGGRSMSDTNASGVTTKTRTTDQSSLVTSFDTTARWRHNQYDDKLVIRDAFTTNFPPGDNKDFNRLSSAYLDHDDKLLGYMARVGRQPGNSQGVLGRFDGAFLRYAINSNYRVTGVVGVPDNGPRSRIQTDRMFYGTAVEFGAPSNSFSGNVYLIQQEADNFTERRAVGSELRYFKNNMSWFGLLDYDTLYNNINIALLQGNWTSNSQITYNLLLDHRKTPILYSETAVPSVTGAQSVSDLLGVLTKRQIITAVNSVTADTDTALFGATKQVTDKWQLGGDVRLNRTSGTQGNGAILATAGTGTVYTYSLQAIGSNTIFSEDTSVINTSLIDDPHYFAQVFGLTNVVTYRSKWHVTSSMNLYHERRDTDQKTIKAAPVVRVSYQMFDKALLETEVGFEKSYVNDVANDTKTRSTREFMFIGYRWDF
ncbi:MAG TPA: hypothetical protein DCO68_12975 [Methylophilaceae bacterium]|nr:hypothetical protein [Methylophilaceae bacterium]HAJ72981.1 hypothetical protein [Methylophilaceae bacterium]